jgi:hypothetical protein
VVAAAVVAAVAAVAVRFFLSRTFHLSSCQMVFKGVDRFRLR